VHANTTPSAARACAVIFLKVVGHVVTALLVVAAGLAHAATYYLASRLQMFELWLAGRTRMPPAGAHIGAGLASAVTAQFPRPTTTRR
jgi:hypothetical protein